MHKVHNNAVPESLCEIFSVNSNQRYDLRSTENHYVLSKPHANNLFEKSNLIITPLHQYGTICLTQQNLSVS